MAFAFDTLAYAKRLRDAGVPTDQAEAHAEAAQAFIMAELVTRTDLEGVRRELDTSILATRRDLESAKRELETSILATRTDLQTARRELDTSILTTRRDLEGAIERLTLRLTVRLGGLIAIGVAILAMIIKL